MPGLNNSQVGIAAIAVHKPTQCLRNDWFGARLPRKFVSHTGTLSRCVSTECEASLAMRAIELLREKLDFDIQDCVSIVFVSPSFVPLDIARKNLAPHQWRSESFAVATRELTQALQLVNCRRYGINWFCSGYAKALQIVNRQTARSHQWRRDQFMLVVTASCISRITDYGCPQTGPLFGDLSTVTLMSRVESQKYPVKFRVTYAEAETRSAAGAYFDFDVRDNVLGPTGERSPSRLVFRLDGLGIADVAPRAMADALAKALAAQNIELDRLRFIIPHQAGTGIVRLASMKFEELSTKAQVINDITGDIGNVSSGSIPYALSQKWDDLEGLIACPTAGVGAPGKAEVTQGCILLECNS